MAGFAEKPFSGERFYASRALLPVEASTGLAPFEFGLANRTGLRRHFSNPGLSGLHNCVPWSQEIGAGSEAGGACPLVNFGYQVP